MGGCDREPDAEEEPCDDSLAAKEDNINGTAENLQFCKGNILAILQNPPRRQDSRPPGHHVCLEETNNVARNVHAEPEKGGCSEEIERGSLPNQPSKHDEQGCKQLSDYNSSLEEADVVRGAECEDSENALHCRRKRNPVVFLDEFSQHSNLPVSSILCNPVLKVSTDDPAAGGKLDVGCGTEAEEIHAVRQNIVFL